VPRRTRLRSRVARSQRLLLGLGHAGGTAAAGPGPRRCSPRCRRTSRAP
jgi:hypothetical protein